MKKQLIKEIEKNLEYIELLNSFPQVFEDLINKLYTEADGYAYVLEEMG